MTLGFLSPAYFLMLLVCLGPIVLLYFLLRRRSTALKRGVVLALMLLNIFQHLAKGIVWPHLYGTGFSYVCTFYNVCASLILLSPFILLFGKGAMRDFLVYVGTAGPLLAIVVPFWFQGQDLFQWEVLRFYVCHALLIATSSLSALLGLIKLSWRNALVTPLWFFVDLILILFNETICVALGMTGNGTEHLFETLYALNPCWVMHPAPPAGFEWTKTVLEALSPAVFLGDGTRPYVPLLWYAVPMYLLLTLLALSLGILFDRKRFSADMKALIAKFKKG